MLALVLILLIAGCAGPFQQSKPSAPQGGVALSYCGSSDSSPESIVKAMEPPTRLPPEVSGGELEPPEELRVCLKLENQSSQVARLDRTLVMLKCPREKQNWQPDRDDQEIIAHPGETRELHVNFHYTALPRGEEVSLTFERALTVGGKPLSLPPLVLRKR